MARTLKVLQTPPTPDIITSVFLGQCVRAKRTQLGLRIDEAAAYCNVAKDTLMKLEHGHPKVQLATVLQICQNLGIQLQIKEEKGEDDVWV